MAPNKSNRSSDGEKGNSEERRRLNPDGPDESIGSAGSLEQGPSNHRSADRLLEPDRQSLTLIDDNPPENFYDQHYPRNNHTTNGRRFDNISQAGLINSGMKPKLAKADTIEEDEKTSELQNQDRMHTSGALSFCRFLTRHKFILVLLIILSCMAAIYCIPFVDINPRIPKSLPNIPFNYKEGPLQPSDSDLYEVENLFNDQIYGPESIAIDSLGNMYLAVEGGFILYAHVNTTSPINQAYLENRTSIPQETIQMLDNQVARLQLASEMVTLGGPKSPELIKIAELNPIKQVPYEQRRREGVSSQSDSAWRRECQVDERVYGRNLWSPGDDNHRHKFTSKVVMSRCSKPLGIRLTPDENFLYVIDTMNGLYKIHLRVSERQQSTQRHVNKMIDFKTNKNHLLPVTFFDLAAGQNPNLAITKRDTLDQEPPAMRVPAFLNVSLKAVDDLVIDYGAGTRGSDMIYMSVGSQRWNAVGFVYEILEGWPSGAILRYDTGTNQLTILSPNQIAHVRTSSLASGDASKYSRKSSSTKENQHKDFGEDAHLSSQSDFSYTRMGAPHLDENDIFDDRPLFFPNGLELTDDRQALLIADTVNKRIIKHFIRGSRRGTSDLWAWTPNYPDNIRRGSDRKQETYWVAGCGHDTTGKIDLLAWLNGWPRVRKFLLKNIYLFGWLVETIGTNIMRSDKMRDYGYSIRVGHSLCQSMCPGMMILQYSSSGELMRSIHSEEFPDNLAYYSQANEIIDKQNQQHYLYLSSPSYNYVTKLMLPKEIPPNSPST